MLSYGSVPTSKLESNVEKVRLWSQTAYREALDVQLQIACHAICRKIRGSLFLSRRLTSPRCIKRMHHLKLGLVCVYQITGFDTGPGTLLPAAVGSLILITTGVDLG